MVSIKRSMRFLDHYCCNIPISLIDSNSSLEWLMRWLLVCLGSLAIGMLTIIMSLLLLLVSLSIYDKYVPSNGLVREDPVHHFAFFALMNGVITIPALFVLGCFVGFWFLQKRILR
jgi:hypothetical protein